MAGTSHSPIPPLELEVERVRFVRHSLLQDAMPLLTYDIVTCDSPYTFYKALKIRYPLHFDLYEKL